MPCKSETVVAGGDVAEAVAADVDGCVAAADGDSNDDDGADDDDDDYDKHTH